jgi:hypothetical protein
MNLNRILVGTLLLTTPAVSLAQAATRLEARQLSLAGQQATVFKSPSCGCCEGYIAFLREHGVEVTVVSSDDALAKAKAEHSVPLDAQSCHTVLLGGYVVEGHVPLAALEKLLAEQPDLTGIAMPGMPTGTPGMEGPQFGPLNVVGFGEAGVTPFMTL